MQYNKSYGVHLHIETQACHIPKNHLAILTDYRCDDIYLCKFIHIVNK